MSPAPPRHGPKRPSAAPPSGPRPSGAARLASIVLIALVACGPDDPARSRPGPPTLLSAPELALPDGPVGLARVVRLTADRPVTVTLTVDDGQAPFTVRTEAAAEEHEIPVLGLHPEGGYTLDVVVADERGREATTAPLSFATGPLPAALPDLEVLTHDRARREAGYTLVDVQIALSKEESWAVILDEDLQVTWYYDGVVTDLRRTDEGTLLGIFEGAVAEMDLLGRTLRRYGRDGLPVDGVTGFHHEAHPLGDGAFVSLTNDVVEAPSYPPSYLDPTGDGGPAPIRDNPVVVVDADGQLLARHSLAALLDTHHIGWGSLDWLIDTDTLEEGYDWSHANAVILGPDGEGFVVSARHQDALFRLDGDGALEWILGDPIGWDPAWLPYMLEPVGEPFRWPLHQHAPAWAPDGTLVVFDNRNAGRSPYHPPGPATGTARIVAYRVDEARHEVEQVWEYVEPPGGPVFSDSQGDADPLPRTGNVLALYGSVTSEGGVTNDELGRGHRSVRLIELVPATGEAVLDLRLSTDGEAWPTGCTAYRAERLDALYPPGFVVTEGQ